MTQGTISPALLRRKIEETAGHRCGYCLTPQEFITIRLEIDHLIPIAAGGIDTPWKILLYTIVVFTSTNNQHESRYSSTSGIKHIGGEIRLWEGE